MLLSASAARLSVKNQCNLYYYCSFSCFFTKIFSMTTSFRMTSFAPREAMTTAEPPEPFESFTINVLFQHGILSGIIGPAARQSVKKISVISVICGFINLVVAMAMPGDLWFS